MAEETENVAEEIQQEEAVQPQEQVAPESQSPEPAPTAQEISDKEINFQKLREKAERLERENEELKRSSYKEPEPSQEDDLGIDDDDIPDGKLVKKLYKEIATLKKTYVSDKAASVPDRLKSKFTDFDSVVTKDNIEKLKQTEPEIYSSIISGSDLYAKGVSAYKTLKALGIAKEDPYKEQKSQVQQNQSRPVSTQAIKGQGALAEANIFAKGLTPELRKQLNQEMAEAVKAR